MQQSQRRNTNSLWGPRTDASDRASSIFHVFSRKQAEGINPLTLPSLKVRIPCEPSGITQERLERLRVSVSLVSSYWPQLSLLSHRKVPILSRLAGTRHERCARLPPMATRGKQKYVRVGQGWPSPIREFFSYHQAAHLRPTHIKT